MKEILKKDWPYLVLAIILVILSILSIDSFKYGFNTAYDQAYMLLKLQEAYDGSFITGKSQWNLLAIHIFPYLDLTNKANSYIAANILNWITIIIGTITACLLFDKKRLLMYFAIIFLVYFHNANHGQGLSYVTMQGAFSCWALCFYLLFEQSEKMVLKYIYAFLTGLILGISCFVILPGALVVTVFMFFVIILRYKSNILQLCKFLGMGILGAMGTIALVHTIICPIDVIIDAMVETSKFFTKATRYDGYSMALMYFFFFRNFAFMIVAFIGMYWLSKQIKNKLLGKILYMAISVFYIYYMNKLSDKIQVDCFMAIASMAFIPYLFNKKQPLDMKDLINPDVAKNIFLFLFPIIAVFGTNTGVIHRLYLFTMPWLFLYWQQTHAKQAYPYKELLIPILFFFVIPAGKAMNTSIPQVMREHKIIKNECKYHFTKGNEKFAKIGITKTQYDYFEKVDSLLKVYNYAPNKSTMFAMVYDYANIYVYNAVNASHFHAVEYFPYMDVSAQEPPDFLFICRMDSVYIDNYLRETHWNWPEAYDEYSVGCPEDLRIPAWYNIPDINKRYLYCRKSLKKAQ